MCFLFSDLKLSGTIGVNEIIDYSPGIRTGNNPGSCFKIPKIETYHKETKKMQNKTELSTASRAAVRFSDNLNH